MHPGEAVVIGDTSISMNRLDDVSGSVCKVSVALGKQQAQQGAPAKEVAGGDARRQAAQVLIDNVVAKKLAADLDVSVPPSKYVLTEQQLGQIRKVFGSSNLEGITKVFEMSQQTSLLVAAIGAEKLGTDPQGADQQKAKAAGQKALQKAVADADLSVDPRLGLSDKAVATDTGTGSLSVGVSSLADASVSDYAAAQRCS
ncbi:MAG: hypothetical protein ACRDO8_13275 [Nocardioidaceae bacterium]